jgi:DNA repair exonuclease SbcCD nuclease subunit
VLLAEREITMEIGFLGDIHFAEYKDFSTDVLVEWDSVNLKYIKSDIGKKMNSRLLDIANAMIEARDYFIANEIKLVIITGDISHNRGAVPTIVQNVEYNILESYKHSGIEVIINPGNHDQVSNEDFPENSLTPFRNIATIIEKPTILLRNNINILFVPFSANKSIVMDAINDFNPKSTFDSNIIVAHLGVSGGFTGKNSYVLTDQYEPEELRYLDEDIDLIALGHYHKPQLVEGTLNKVIYTGSPVPVSFNEEGEEHGLWIFDTSTKAMYMHPLKSPKFITLNKENYSDFSTEDLKGNFVRIVGNLEEVADINAAVTIDPEDKNIENNMIRIETQKEYEAEHRSDINPEMSYAESVFKYAEENDFTEEQVATGIEILNSVLENYN